VDAEETARRLVTLGLWIQDVRVAGLPAPLDREYLIQSNDIWTRVNQAVPDGLKDLDVLDVGCNAGLFCLLAERAGARRVVGVENDPRYLAQAHFLREWAGADYELRDQSVYDLDTSLGDFDLVLCCGLLYHLRYPLYGLEKITARCRSTLFIESEFLKLRQDSRLMRFVRARWRSDTTTWWIPGEECVVEMLRDLDFGQVHAVPFTEGVYADPRYSAGYATGLQPHQIRGILVARRHAAPDEIRYEPRLSVREAGAPDEGRITIEDLEIQGPDGRPTDTLRTGERATVAVRFTASGDPPNPVFRVLVFDSEGRLLLGQNNHRLGLDLSRLPLSGRLVVEFDPLLLLAGEYDLAVGFWPREFPDPDPADPYDTRRHPRPLRVVSERRHGGGLFSTPLTMRVIPEAS
jgi:tRNA (mo5U34)-methyltransferase